jgi:hypothetical protein
MENPTKLAKNVQQYIELVYSEKSNLNEIIDLDERKIEACKVAKMDEKSDESKAIMDMDNQEVSEMIFQYIIRNNSNDFALLMADQQLFTNQIKQILDPKTDIVLRNKLSEQSDKLLIRVRTRMQSIFQGSAEVKIASQKLRTMRPEDRLKALKSA